MTKASPPAKRARTEQQSPRREKEAAEVGEEEKNLFGLKSVDLNQVMKETEPVNEELNKLDEECAREQMAIQRKFEEKKKPHLKKRDEQIRKVRKLWAAIVTAPCEQVLTHAETELIAEHLDFVRLEDNQDDNGTYEVSFIFNEEAKEVFSPTTWTKKVVFLPDGGIDASKTSPAQVKFVDVNKDPREIVKKLAKGEKVQDEEGLSGDEAESILAWFTAKDEVGFEYGEMFRRFIYPTPFAPFTASDEEESDEDEEEDEQ